MIVVDSNVLAYFFLPTPYSEQAEACFTKDTDWIAPTLWRSEFRNILAGYMRKALLSTDEAKSIMGMAEGLMNGHEFQTPSDKVIDLVSKSKCSAYDCEFVALAKDLGLKLVTADKEVLREFPGNTVALSHF